MIQTGGASNFFWRDFMKLLLLACLVLLVSCNGGGGGGSSSEPKVSAGDVTSTQNANIYIQESQNQIPPSLRVKKEDLESLKAESLVTQEEALELSQIITE